MVKLLNLGVNVWFLAASVLRYDGFCQDRTKLKSREISYLYNFHKPKY